MNIQNKTILFTGANRGIGRALVTEALRRGAKRVYAGTRSGELQNADSRFSVLSLSSIAAVPFSPAYSISKATAFSLSQSLRALLAGRGVKVHVVLPGPVDTDMTRDLDISKASPKSVARAIFDGVEKGEEDIFPDPMSASIADSWRSGAAKLLERQFAAFVPE